MLCCQAHPPPKEKPKIAFLILTSIPLSSRVLFDYIMHPSRHVRAPIVDVWASVAGWLPSNAVYAQLDILCEMVRAASGMRQYNHGHVRACVDAWLASLRKCILTPFTRAHPS